MRRDGRPRASTEVEVLGMAKEAGQRSVSSRRCPRSPFAFAKQIPQIGLCSGTLILLLAGPACGQDSSQASILEMKRQIEALQRRVEELESEHRTSKTHASAPKSQTAHASKSAKPKTPSLSIERGPP